MRSRQAAIRQVVRDYYPQDRRLSTWLDALDSPPHPDDLEFSDPCGEGVAIFCSDSWHDAVRDAFEALA